MVNAAIKIKRKRAPVCPFATISMCEKVVKLLAKEEFVRELSSPKEWRINPSTESRGKGFHYERRLWVKNDVNACHIAKLRQHAQDPSKSARRSGFEGGFVSKVNSAFAELLRRAIWDGGRRTLGEEGTSNRGHGDPEDLSPQNGSKQESPDAFGATGKGSKGRGTSTCPSLEPHGGSSDTPGKIETNTKERRGEGGSRTTTEPDSWTNYSSCRGIDNPSPSPYPHGIS